MGKSPCRKPKITKEIEDFIVTTSDEDRRLTSSEIRDKVQQTFCVEVNACTIRLQKTLSTNQKMLENYCLFHVVCTYFPEFGFSKKKKMCKGERENLDLSPPLPPLAKRIISSQGKQLKGHVYIILGIIQFIFIYF